MTISSFFRCARLIQLILVILAFSVRGMCFAIDIHAVEYPPYTSINMKGNGIAFVALDRFLLNKGLEVQPKFLPPARLSKELTEGNWCVSFVPPNNKTLSEQVFLDNNPIRLGLFSLAPNDWKKLDELADKRIALLRTFNGQSALVSKLTLANINLVEVETIAQGLKLLKLNRVDFLFADDVSIEYLQGRQFNDLEAVYFTGQPLMMTKISIWLNLNCKANEKLRSVNQ